MTRQLHHIGIPVTTPVAGEAYNSDYHLYCTDPAESPNKIEFLRFQEGCPFPALVQNMPHIAYQVPSMEEALKGAKVIYGPFTPVEGMDVVFIEEEGIPVELDYFY